MSTTAPPTASPASGGLDLALRVPGRLDATLQAPAGSVVAVLGPNGAGKSTLVRALAGLQHADGHAHLDGVDLLGLDAGRRRVGVVFQDRLLFPHLSALANVAFGPRSRGVDRRRSTATARAWLERLGVGDLAERRPSALSGGQAQRVAIARALATDPVLLLMDEPFAGLDVGVAARLRVELREHLAAFDGVTLLVTHDALDALTLADRVLVLDQGRTAQTGTPRDVAARPLTAHVARLVGLNVVAEQGVLRAFRPSAVTVSLRRPTSSARLAWAGPVTHLAPHGDAVRLQVSAGEHDLIADVTVEAVADLGLAPGRRVWLTVKATAVDTYGEEPRPG